MAYTRKWSSFGKISNHGVSELADGSFLKIDKSDLEYLNARQDDPDVVVLKSNVEGTIVWAITDIIDRSV